MKQFYIKVLLFIYFLIIISSDAFIIANNHGHSILPTVKGGKTVANTKGKEANPKKKTLIAKISEKKRPLKAPSLLVPRLLNPQIVNTQFSPLLGPDPFMFTITSSKESVNIGEEVELTVKVSWLDFGINNGVRFLPEWYKYTLKVVMPDGFIQTGGNYEDYCTTPVNAENPTAIFTIKGHFEFKPQEPTFKVLRGFEGANEKSEFIWKGEKSVTLKSNKNKNYCSILDQVNQSRNLRINFDNTLKECQNISSTKTNNTYLSNGCYSTNRDPNNYGSNKFGLSIIYDGIVCKNNIVYAVYKARIKNVSENTAIQDIKLLLHGTPKPPLSECYNIDSDKSLHYKSETITGAKILGGCGNTEILIPIKEYQELSQKDPSGNILYRLHAHILYKTNTQSYNLDLPSDDNFVMPALVVYKPVVAVNGLTLSVTSGCPTNSTINWYDNNDPTSSIGVGSSFNVNPPQTTTYKAKCSLAEGCESDWSSEITVDPCMGISLATPSIIGANDGCNQITLTSSIVGVDYSYQWKKDGINISGSTLKDFTATSSGTYTLSVTKSGCTKTSPEKIIIITSKPSVPTTSGGKTLSATVTSATLTASGCDEGTITWNDNASSTGVSINVSPTTTTTYKAKCTIKNCTSDWSAGETVIVITPPSCNVVPPNINTASTTININESTNISATGCSGGTITWNNGGTGNTINVTPQATTTYMAKCTIGDCVSGWSNQIIITVRPLCDIDIAKPIITSNRLQLDEQNPAAELTANGCPYTVKWYKSDGNYIADGMKLYNVGVGQYYAKCINSCPGGMATEMNSDHIIITKESCSTTGYWPTINNNSTGQISDKTFCTSGTVSLSVTGCLDNRKAKWYGTNGNDLGTGSTYTETINSNQTFAVSCENHCKPSERLGWETINFTVIPYDLCEVPNPQIINNTPGRVTEFCGNGQFSVSANGCPDGNRVKWWVGNGSSVQGSDYSAYITSTTEARFQCISPVTGDLIGPQQAIRFIVNSFSDCNYRASIVNNTPGQKTVFCTKGWVDLETTGCPNNSLVRWYTDGTELNGGVGIALRGTITRTSRIGVNCINPNDNTEFGWNEITFKVDNSGCDPNKPTIINNTSHGYNKFCKKGWVSLEVDGCPDNTKAKWYKDNTFIKQSAIYKEVINQTATYKVTCENPLYESSYSEIKFDVLTNGDCYIPSIVNLTPNGQTDFCGSGTLKLMMTGCNTNYPPTFEEHVDGKASRYIGGTWEQIDGINTIILNYNATESGYFKVFCRTSEYEIIWQSQQIIKFNVNPIPIISAVNTPVCVGSQFSLSAVVPNIPINTGDIKFDWTNASNASVGNRQNILLVAENSTPTTFNVKFTNNKGCSATASTIVTNYAKPVVSVSNSSITQCAGTILNLNSNVTVGSGKATVQVKLEENLTSVDRSIVLTISGTTNPTPTSVTITQKGKTNATCVTCLNNNITDGQIIGYRDIDQPNQKAIIKIENGCAKAWWYDLNEAVHTDWIPFLKNKLYPDSVLRSCITFYNLNNCANNKGCNQGSTSGITNFTSAGGITSFEITLPSVNGTWAVTKPTGSDKNWLSFVNAVSGSTSITGGGGLSYNWTKGTTFKSSLQNPSIPNIQAADAGTYKAEVTDIRNCVGSANVNVVVDALPNATVSNTTPTTFCQGGTVVLSAITGLNSYQWKKDGTNISGATGQNYTANASGTYTVQVTNNKNCTATSNGAATGKVVLVNPTPPTPVAMGATICNGNTVSLSASGCSGSVGTFYLSWFKASGDIPVTMPVNPTINTDYYAKCTQTANGISCTSVKSANVSVIVNTPPSITTQPVNKSICSGQNHSFTVVATGTGLSFQWQISTGSSFSNIAGQTASTLTINNATIAMNGYKYRCLVSGSCTPSVTTNEAILTVSANPNVTANATNLNVSTGQSVTLQASGASSYTWTGPDGFTSSVQNPIISNFSAAKAGIYTVTGLSGTCSTKANVTITLNTCPVSATTLINICAGQTTTFTASGGDTYEWQGPPNGQPFIERIANPKIYNSGKVHEGKYTVTISKTGTNACSAKFDVQLNVSDPFGSTPHIVDNTDRSNCASSLSLKVLGCPAGTTSYKWYDISPENPEANRSQVLSTTDQLVRSVAWNYPLIKVECITPSITSCPSISVIANVLTIKKPSITIKNIIQPCEYELSTAAVPIGKVTFEIKNANSLTGYALARSDASIPFSWGAAVSAFQGSSGTSGAGGYSYSFIPNSIKVIQERPESELPPKHLNLSETLFNIKNANIPASGTRWRLFLLDNETKCIAYTEEFEVYKPNQSIFINPVSQDNVVNCFNDFGSTTINLQSNNFVTGNIFEGNKQLFTKIVNNAIQVLDDKNNVIKNVTKTSGVGTDVNRGYKINLTGLPATTTIKAYQDACIGSQANTATCEQLPRYRISFVPGDGCTYTSPRFVVQQPNLLELYANANNPNCFGEKIPSVELIANGGNIGKQFYLVNGTTETKVGDADANGKFIVQASQYGATAPYTFKVKDAKSCNVTATITKSAMLQFVATAIIDAETPDVATMTFAGGQKPFYYAVIPISQTSLPNSTQWSSISENSGYVDGDPINSKAMAPGKYKVYMKYGNCQTLTNPINITIGTKAVPEPPIIPSNAICASSVEQIKEQVKCNQPFCDVKWYSNATGGDTLRLQEDIVNSMTNIGKKEFYVSTKIQGTDKETSTRVKVSLLFVPNATVNASNITICQGASISLANLATINNPTSYALTGEMALQLTTPENKAFDDVNFLPDKSGLYKIKQQYKESSQSLSCSSSGKDLTLTVIPAPPTPSLVQKEYTYCTNMVATAISPTKSNTNNGLLWIDPNKTIANSYTATTSTVGAKTVQVYELAYKSASPQTEANACRSLLPLTISLNTVATANLPIPTIKVGAAICNSNKVSLEANGCGTDMTVNWQANTATAGAYQSVGTGLTYAASPNLSYKANCVVKAGACEGQLSNEVAVTTAMTTFNVKITTNSPVAQYQTLELKALASPTATYTWAGPNTFTSTLQNPRIVDLTSAVAGTYTVTAKESSCTATSTVIVAVNQVADCNIKIKAMSGTTETYKFPSTRSASSSALTLSVIDNVSPAYWNVSPTTYSWKDPEGVISTESTLIAAKKGEYTLQITKDGKQCESSVILNGTPCGDVLAYACNPNSIAAPPTGVTPLKVLKQGDEIFAGDFKARIISSTGNGTFSGTAGVKIPYLADAEILTTFSNLQLNECYELQSGANNKLITVYNPAAGLIVDADKVIDVVKEVADALNTLIQTSINKDYKEIKAFKEATKNYVRANLPTEMVENYTRALDDLDNAKLKYDACAKAVPQDKTCMEQADKDFKAAQAKLKDLKKQEDELVNNVTNIILKAVKKLGNEGTANKPLKQTAYNSSKIDIDSKSAPRSTTNVDETNILIYLEEESEAQETEVSNQSISAYKKSFESFAFSETDLGLQNLSLALFSQFSTQERLKLLGTSLTNNTNGKSLIYSISNKISKNESETSIVDFATIELKRFLLTVLSK